jgi:hypothetical protein
MTRSASRRTYTQAPAITGPVRPQWTHHGHDFLAYEGNSPPRNPGRRRPATLSPCRREYAAHVHQRTHLPKSTSAVVTVPAMRPGTLWLPQYRLVWAITRSGVGAPYSLRSSVVWASLTSVAS